MKEYEFYESVIQEEEKDRIQIWIIIIAYTSFREKQKSGLNSMNSIEDLDRKSIKLNPGGSIISIRTLENFELCSQKCY